MTETTAAPADLALLNWLETATILLCNLAEDSGMQIDAENLRTAYNEVIATAANALGSEI